MRGVEPVELMCPCCGERITVLIDCSIEQQEYTEDCEVCCAPIVLRVSVPDETSPPVVAARPENA